MKTPCTTCGKPLDPIDIFPQGNCLDCHDKLHREDPITPPDFIGTINK